MLLVALLEFTKRKGGSMTKIPRTTGQLRQKLAGAILDLQAGKITPKEANKISAEAGKVNKQLRKRLKAMKP